MLAFHQHIHRFTETVQWHGETVATITDLFYSVDAPIHAVIEQNSVVTPSTQSALSASGTNTSFLTARESNRLEADKDSLSMSDDELDDELHLRVAALRSVINKKKSRLVFNSNQKPPVNSVATLTTKTNALNVAQHFGLSVGRRLSTSSILFMVTNQGRLLRSQSQLLVKRKFPYNIH
jgi:hypothetical protein